MMFSHVMKKIVCPIRIANDLFLFKGVRIIHLVGDPIKQTISEWPSSKNPHFQNEGKCKTFHVKISFICMRINNHFHINGFALCLALKQRLGPTRKWPIKAKAMHEFRAKFLAFCISLKRPPASSLNYLFASQSFNEEIF